MTVWVNQLILTHIGITCHDRNLCMFHNFTVASYGQMIVKIQLSLHMGDNVSGKGMIQVLDLTYFSQFENI